MAGMTVLSVDVRAAVALEEYENEDTPSIGRLFQKCDVYFDQSGTAPERFVSLLGICSKWKICYCSQIFGIWKSQDSRITGRP
jgi:hypothetical protein